MKKTLFYTLILAGSLASCKKDTDPIFDDPDKRLIAEVARLEKELTEAPHGWKAALYPKGGQGYMYYFQFNNQNGVTIYSDFNNTQATQAGGGTYRIKALQQPTLIFDTYSYVHFPADPDETISGGTRGTGLSSDIQFFIYGSGDSLFLKGIDNGSQMTLVKATAEEKTQIQSGAIKTMMDKSAAFVRDTENPYMEFGDGIQTQFTISRKLVSLTWVDAQGEISTTESPFVFFPGGIELKNPLNYKGTTFDRLFWDDNLGRYYAMIGNARYDVLSSPTPIIPPYFRIGFGKDFTTFTVNVPTLDGLPPAFLNVYNAAVTGLAGLSGRKFQQFAIIFSAANEMTLRITYQNTAGTTYLADFLHSVEWSDGGVCKFTYMSRNGNGNTISTGVTALTNYIADNEFKLSWAANLTPGSTALLGGLTLTSDPNNYFFGVLSK